MMWWKRIATVSLVAGMFVSVGASGAGATEADPVFGDGRYVLVIPGVAPFGFEVYVDYPVDGQTVTTWAYPDGYTVDDDDPDKEAWIDAASLEVEMKLDKIESDVIWDDGLATLKLPDGSIITVTAPNADGDFTVMAGDDPWTAFGWGDDWIVANHNTDIDKADLFFKVEATADGIEIKAVSGPGDGFEEEYEEEDEEEEAEEVESEDDDSEGAGQGKEKNKGKGKNN
jgi:hypothetical protein